MTTISGVQPIFGIEPGQRQEAGIAAISAIEWKEDKDPLYNLRMVRDGYSFMRMHQGKYLRLHVGGKLMMSDTPMERITNGPFFQAANGNVFIAGLGIGLPCRPPKSKPPKPLLRPPHQWAQPSPNQAPHALYRFRPSKSQLNHFNNIQWK